MKVYSIQEVAGADGREGRKAFVVVDDKVYDLSSSKKWIAGTHMSRHRAGMDLSREIRSSPHGTAVLSRLETIGAYEGISAPVYEGFRKTVEDFLKPWPFFRRHPHPAIVHFPVAFLLVAPFLEIIALIFGAPKIEWSAFCCLVVGVASVPPSIMTGYFTWWINYDFVDASLIRTKRRLAWVALGLGLISLILRASNDSFHMTGLLLSIYVLALIALGAIVGLVGFFGGKLTIPYE